MLKVMYQNNVNLTVLLNNTVILEIYIHTHTMYINNEHDSYYHTSLITKILD